MAKKAMHVEMTTAPFLEAATIKETSAIAAPARVCMHVLVPAATDVRVKRAATALVKAGYSVSIVDIEDATTHPEEEEVYGVTLKHIMVSPSFLSTRFEKWTVIRMALLFVRSTLCLLRTPTDIYHAHDSSALPACFLVSLLRHKPLIFDAHEAPADQRPPSSMGRSRRWTYKLLTILLTYIVPRFAGIVTVSPTLVEEIRNRYHVPQVTLVRNILEYQDVPRSDRLRQHLGLAPQVRLALYTGYILPSRGLDQLVRAAAFLQPDSVIVIMGKGVGTAQAQLEALIASEGVAERVKILPPVPYTELLDWTSSADIGLYVASPDYSLNVRMTLPNKLFEYLMAGLPVLCSPIEPMADVIKAYDVGQILPSLTPAKIGAAINAMMADGATLDRMHRNALNASQRELNWETESQQLIRLYQRILQNGPQRRNSAHRPASTN